MIQDTPPISGLSAPYDLLASILQDGTSEWRAELWGVDPGPEATTWRAYPGGPSMGAIMLHIIAVEIYWFELFVLGLPGDSAERDLLLVMETDVDEGIWPDPPAQPLSWYLALHDRIRARTLEGMKDWPAPDVLKERGDRQTSPRWVLGHVIQHEAYHGGQIVLLFEHWKKSRADS